MRTVIVACFLLAATAVHARPSSVAMTCGQAARLVASQGAVVLGTGGQTFDRFVSSRRFCEVTEYTQSAFVPTRDTPSCFVGYRCYEPGRDDVLEKF